MWEVIPSCLYLFVDTGCIYDVIWNALDLWTSLWGEIEIARLYYFHGVNGERYELWKYLEATGLLSHLCFSTFNFIKFSIIFLIMCVWWILFRDLILNWVLLISFMFKILFIPAHVYFILQGCRMIIMRVTRRIQKAIHQPLKVLIHAVS